MGIFISDFRSGHRELVGGKAKYKPGPSKSGKCCIWGKINNDGDKAIKYVVLYFEARNGSGDTLMDIMSRETRFKFTCNDPIEPGKSWSFEEEEMLFNHAVDAFVAVEAMIAYEDGSVERQSPVRLKTASGGCYVATAVYGSYDCPQVWTLRRYRDDVLASTWYGRAFIRFYYAVSPTLVKWFGNTSWFRDLWRGKLDRMVDRLRGNGVEDTPYEDKNWF